MIALGWTLIHMLWQGALVAGLLGLTRVIFPRATAQLRYGLACTALAALLLLPFATFWSVWAALPAASLPGPTFVTPLGPPLGLDQWGAHAIPWLLALWGLGVGTLGSRSVLGWLHLRRVVRDEACELDSAWRTRMLALSRRAGLRQVVRVLTTRTVSTPIVTGCLRPTILLPLAALTGLPSADLEALVLHELMHIRRWDLWVHRLQLVLETLFFYHPAVWWISHTANVEREFCCDAAVIEVTGDRIGYARALTRMELLRSPTTPRQALAATGGSLMTRVRRIVNPVTESHRAPLSTAAWSLASVGLLVLLVASSSVIGGSLVSQTPAWMSESVGQWSPLFDAAAERHGVDPALLSIMTLVESNGNPDAVSSRGAVGLMQIMPSTAHAIATARGMHEFELEDLRDPATNIDLGAWFVAQQIETFGDGTLSDTTVELAAAAYNGGPQLLRRHIHEGAALTAESARYSKLVKQLWLDRHKDQSSTFDGLMLRRR